MVASKRTYDAFHPLKDLTWQSSLYVRETQVAGKSKGGSIDEEIKKYHGEKSMLNWESLQTLNKEYPDPGFRELIAADRRRNKIFASARTMLSCHRIYGGGDHD
ncbi:MAG: hypothetical protein Q9181_005987 [Wetmoreana brouardii]